MKLFIDASALVAILAQETDHRKLSEMLDSASERYWSAMSCWETINALRKSRSYDLEMARDEVEAFADARSLSLVSIGEAERALALSAYRRFGKGRHKAKLNFGDCFAYACARSNGARLLYKGDDFSHTDLAWSANA